MITNNTFANFFMQFEKHILRILKYIAILLQVFLFVMLIVIFKQNTVGYIRKIIQNSIFQREIHTKLIDRSYL